MIENLNAICAQPEFVRGDKDFQNYIVKGFLLQAMAVGRALGEGDVAVDDKVKNFVPQLSDFVRVFAVSDVASESSVHLESFGKIAPAMRSFAPELKNKIAQEFLQRCHDFSFTRKSFEVLCKQIGLDRELDGDGLKRMFDLRNGLTVQKITVAPAASAIASGAERVVDGAQGAHHV